METTTRLLLPDVSEALRVDPSLVVEMLEELHPADVADLTAALPDDLALRLIQAIPVEAGARLLEALDADRRAVLVEQLAAADNPGTAELVEEMAPDEAADLFADLPEETRSAVLAAMPQEDQRDLRQLLAYPDGTAGALMTTDFVAVFAGDTVSTAIEVIRRDAQDMETINYAYVVDPHGIMLGVLSLRDLVLARGDRVVSEIMAPNVIAVEDGEDQGEVTRLLTKYGLLAMPVVDRSRRIVGIITVDDVVEVIEEAAADEVQRLGAVAPLEHGYFQTSLWGFVARRAPWLVILFIAGFATSAAMKTLTGTFESAAPLLWFVPLIISAGGNSGSQSATLMIRGLALDEVKPTDILRVVLREAGIGLALGLILGVFGVGRALAWDATRTGAIVLTVSISVVLVVMIGSILGAGLPLLLKRLGLDPAVSSTPFIASLSDVLGLVIYYEIATLLVI